MSFFRRGDNTSTPPPGGYNRVPDPNFGQRPRPPQQHAPPSAQYNQPPYGYNDPTGDLFEKRRPPGAGAPPPRGGGRSIFQVVQSPTDALALSNCIAGHPSDFQNGQHVLVKGEFAITVRTDNSGVLHPGQIGASAPQRQWMGLSLTGDQVSVEPIPNPPHPLSPAYLESVDLEVGFMRKNQQVAEVYQVDDMTKVFVRAYSGIVISADQILAFEYHGQNLKATVKGVSILDLADEQRKGAGAQAGQRLHNHQYRGILMDKTDVNFVKAPDSAINLKSSAKKPAPNAILAPNFKFEDMGIGGLDTEFAEIFRRAFASRVFPPGLVERLGIEHVKGILLHGPPGTGKTLIARQIGKMLNAREPKVVNGPEILSKYVGASEENIRKLFADAEKEYKEKKEESGLHIIIFDELDAIFKQRGSTNSGTGVGDTVVNQLLSKMDGVDQLNNILIIGMTNRKDMIDEALLRPGRLEVHMEISLPDEKGRYQILSIHTSKMRHNKIMDSDVDLYELAAMSKNFSGAEISGLIKSATSFAFNRHIKVGTVAGISDDVENMKVNRQDFLNALDEVHPAFGVSEEELAQVVQNGIIHFNAKVDEILQSGKLYIDQVRSSTRTPLVSVLLHGLPGTGKTALAAQIAQSSEFPFIKLISPDNMVGYGEAQKVNAISKVFADSYKSPVSVVVVDNIERLIDWTPLGARFSNSVLQTLLVLLAKRPPKGRRLLIIATTSSRPVLSELGLVETFDSELHIPPITDLKALDVVMREVELFRDEQERKYTMGLLQDAGFNWDADALADGDATGRKAKLQIGVKKLLSMIEMARQEPEDVGHRLTSALLGLGM